MRAFDETWMSAGDPLVVSDVPGFGSGNRTPETSRVHKRRAKGVREGQVRKGLARSAVAVVRKTPRTFEVRVKGSRVFLGEVRKVVDPKGRKAYVSVMPGREPMLGFTSQGSAVEAMLAKC